jgi:PAS domain-containing protein
MSAVEETGKWTDEIKRLHKNGDIGWIESMCVPFCDADNNVIGTLGINRDISKRVADDLTLKAKQVELKHDVDV